MSASDQVLGTPLWNIQGIQFTIWPVLLSYHRERERNTTCAGQRIDFASTLNL